MPKDEASDSNLALPKTSVKRIMKISDEVGNVAADSIVAVSKVTEQFIILLAKQSREVCEANNRKQIRVEDMKIVIDKNSEQFGFLADMMSFTEDGEGKVKEEK